MGDSSMERIVGVLEEQRLEPLDFKSLEGEYSL
jgi:hypothetical protein